MRCTYCGVFFSPTDILEIDDATLPICDVCGIGYYIIKSNNLLYVVEANNDYEALNKWLEKIEKLPDGKLILASESEVEIQKVDYMLI